jgi:cystathionine gamma-synthase
VIIPIGCPIPLDEHAVSVSMPKWADVVGYEEGDPEVVAIMKIGKKKSCMHTCIHTRTFTF